MSVVAGQLSIDQAITAEILARNVELVIMALGDAATWREEIGEDDAAEAYIKLQGELEEFQDVGL